jgi:tetratricopeptide (TPR) repeat protein
MRLASLLGETVAMRDQLARVEAGHPDWVGKVLAEAAEGVARRSGPATALSMLTTAPGVDYSEPRHAAALRALVQFSHEAGATEATQDTLQAIFAAHPDSSAFQEIRGLDLELSGAPVEAVRAAYAQALELEPGNARALEGLGRLALADDPEAAIAYFDRAVAADPSDPDPKFQAARALVSSGKPAEAAQRLDELLLEHPFEAQAAAERARLDLERGVATPQTLERARRAVRFGRGADDLELLSRVHAQRGEPEPAARAAERARALREARASES